MEQIRLSRAAARVAENATVAAHRRDHGHAPSEESCHPHVVEVVYLGSRAVVVCHDCQADSGFLPHHTAEVVATEHRRQTHETTVALPRDPAAWPSRPSADPSRS